MRGGAASDEQANQRQLTAGTASCKLFELCGFRFGSCQAAPSSGAQFNPFHRVR